MVFLQPEHQERAVREYVEIQARPEKVVHLEKVKTERLRARAHEVWDVWTRRERYWVITNPTNLYSQRDFPSLDYTLSFHIGLMERMTAQQAKTAEAEHPPRFSAPWRRWEEAAEALDEADEAEEFQAVGMRCRECLLALVETIGTAEMVPPGEEPPKRADFINWSSLIANAVARGGSAERVRQYLKALADSSWQLVSWLTHAKNATWADARLATEATQHVLSTLMTAVIRHERGVPQRCPRCSSYRLVSDFRSETFTEVTLCERCGWVDERPEEEHEEPTNGTGAPR